MNKHDEGRLEVYNKNGNNNTREFKVFCMFWFVVVVVLLRIKLGGLGI